MLEVMKASSLAYSLNKKMSTKQRTNVVKEIIHRDGFNDLNFNSTLIMKPKKMLRKKLQMERKTFKSL